MVARDWTVEDAVRCITRQGGEVRTGTIKMETAGIKVLGAIDFLVHKHNHMWVHQNPKKSKKREEE